MRLDWLREFSAIAKEGSFTKAAVTLNLSQSTLSKHMASLERELKVELFAKDGLYMRMTPIGKKFLDDANDIVGRWDDSVRNLARLKRCTPMSLTLYNDTHAKLNDDVIRYAKLRMADKAPLFELKIVESLSFSHAEALRRGMVDVAAVVPYEGLDARGLELVAISKDDLVAVMHRSNPLANRACMPIGDLEGERVLMTEDEPIAFETEQRIREVFARNAVHPRYIRRRAFEARSFGEFDFVEGVLVGARHFLVDNMPAPLLKTYDVLELRGTDCTLTTSLGYKLENSNPAVALFMDSVREISRAEGLSR